MVRAAVRSVPSTLIGGFLGSGKTTLLNHVLRSAHGERLLVLVNDFGALQIDAELIESASEDTIALTNGCVCCTLREDLLGAVQRVLQRPEPPDRLVLELSGLSEPRAVLSSFAVMERSWPLHLDGVVVVVDAEQFPEPDSPHYLLAREQLACADLVVLNKLDLVTSERRDAQQAKLRELLPEARVVGAVEGAVAPEIVLGVGRAGDGELASQPRSSHGESFTTFTFETPAPLALERLRQLATELPRGIYRAKGIVRLDAKPEHRVVLQVVGRRARVSLGEPWGSDAPATRLVFVAERGSVDPEQVRGAFQACVASDGAPRSTWSAALDFVRAAFSRASRAPSR